MVCVFGFDFSVVLWMFKGEWKMSVDEQDGIVDYFGVFINEVVMWWCGEVVGFVEKGQEGFVVDELVGGYIEKFVFLCCRQEDGEFKSYYECVCGCMKGMIMIFLGVDLMELVDFEWVKFYDDE